MHSLADRTSASYRPGRPIEGREQTVAGGANLAAAERGQFSSHHRIVVVEQFAPSRVAELGGALGRGHDIGEHHRGERPIGLVAMSYAGDELLDLVGDDVLGLVVGHEMVLAGNLQVPRPRDMLG
jgi:hypothetical protein